MLVHAFWVDIALCVYNLVIIVTSNIRNSYKVHYVDLLFKIHNTHKVDGPKHQFRHELLDDREDSVPMCNI